MISTWVFNFDHLKKLWPEVVSIVICEISGNLRGKICALFPDALVGLVLYTEEDLRLELSFLLVRQLKRKKLLVTVTSTSRSMLRDTAKELLKVRKNSVDNLSKLIVRFKILGKSV